MTKSLSDDGFISELEAYDLEHAIDRGGYPRIFQKLGEHLVVAGSHDNGEPELDVYDFDSCKEIWCAAKESYAECDCGCPVEYIRDFVDDPFPI